MHKFAAQQLPKFETAVYLTVWPSMFAYIIYQVYLECQVPSSYHDSYLVSGWQILGERKQDVSDFEWHLWSRVWGGKILLWLVGHALLGALVERVGSLNYQNRWLLFLPFSFASCCHLLGWRSLVFLLARAVYCYLVALMKRTWLVWVNCIFLLTTLNTELLMNSLKTIHNESVTDDVVPCPKFVLLLVVTALYDTRLVSFCLEKCREPDLAPDSRAPGDRETSRTGTRGPRGFIDMLNYVHYLPVFYTGPLLTYDKFGAEIYQPRKSLTKGAVYRAVRELARMLFWYSVVEFSLHYLHCNAIELSTDRLYGMDNWRFGGCGYLQVYFFLIKYLLIYGIPCWFARFDGVTTPDGPVCIEVLYSVSQVWRTFDRGYYDFMKRYIYHPLGGSRQGLHKQLAGVLLTFTFVYLWHGTDGKIFVWAFYNVLMIAFEKIGSTVVQRSGLEAYCETNLSPCWQRRLAAVVGIPMSLTTIHSMFVFISGPRIGLLFLQRFLVDYATSGILPVFLCIVYLRNSCCFELHRRFYWKRRRRTDGVKSE